MYPAVKNAWDNNLDLATSNPDQYFSDIHDHINKKRKAPKFFRWHVAGDILNDSYLAGMVKIASDNPKTTFLAFTKQYDIINNFQGNIPDNLTIIFSAWPGLEMNNPNKYPVAWFQDGTETRLPNNTLECPGNCETCGMCFQINKIGLDVCFNKH